MHRPASSRPPWDRSGFWPTVGACLILVGEGIQQSVPWYEVLASCLIVVGIFLGAARRNRFGTS